MTFFFYGTPLLARCCVPAEATRHDASIWDLAHWRRRHRDRAITQARQWMVMFGRVAQCEAERRELHLRRKLEATLTAPLAGD